MGVVQSYSHSGATYGNCRFSPYVVYILVIQVGHAQKGIVTPSKILYKERPLHSVKCIMIIIYLVRAFEL